MVYQLHLLMEYVALFARSPLSCEMRRANPVTSGGLFLMMINIKIQWQTRIISEKKQIDWMIISWWYPDIYDDDILMIFRYLWYFNKNNLLLGSRFIVWIRSRSEWNKIRIKTQQIDLSNMKDENNEYSNYPSVLEVDVSPSPSINALENFWNYLVLLKCTSIRTCLCYNWSHILDNFWSQQIYRKDFTK